MAQLLIYNISFAGEMKRVYTQRVSYVCVCVFILMFRLYNWSYQWRPYYFVILLWRYWNWYEVCQELCTILRLGKFCFSFSAIINYTHSLRGYFITTVQSTDCPSSSEEAKHCIDRIIECLNILATGVATTRDEPNQFLLHGVYYNGFCKYRSF